MTLINILEEYLVGKTISFEPQNPGMATHRATVQAIHVKKILIGSQTAETIVISFTDGSVADFSELELDHFYL
jgi:hypothetical protein